MKINIYYGGRGIVGDPTLYVIGKLQEILEELHVKVERFDLHEKKSQISVLPGTLKEADCIILAASVEWYGIGGLLTQFLDACWLYGDKAKIKDIYMYPVVMSTCYGEREACLQLMGAWETLGGHSCEGITGYIEDTAGFELNKDYKELIEKKAENLYRTISQKRISLPSSTGAVRNTEKLQAQMTLTPQESEQLSKYVSDEEYVKTQKEDIKELASHFKNMLEGDGADPIIKAFEEHFKPQKDFTGTFRFLIEDEKASLVIAVNGETLSVRYGSIENPSVLCKLSSDSLNEIIAGRQTFQRSFMSGGMQLKGDFAIMSRLDSIFSFGI